MVQRSVVTHTSGWPAAGRTTVQLVSELGVPALLRIRLLHCQLGDASVDALALADDAERVRAWTAGDPYAAAGLFQSVEVIEWRKVI